MPEEVENTGSSGTTRDENGEVRHHHHHHHHRSGSTTQSVIYRPSGSGDYSLRTCGKGGSRPPKILPDGTLPVAVFSVLFTALLLAPVILVMFFRNKTLSETNYQLREQLGTLMSQIEGQEQNIATAKPAPATKTRYVEDETDPAPAAPSKPAAAVAPDSAETRQNRGETQNTSDDTIATAVGMTPDEIKALRRDMLLFPNGMRQTEDQDGNTILERDALAQNLQYAFNLLAVGQKRDAEATFDMIASAKPQWPYGHFFAAIAGGNREKMATAVRLLSTARAIGAITAEGELYSAQAALFLKQTSTAASSVNRVALAPSNGAELQLGPIYAPSYAPTDIIAKMRGIRGVSDIRVIDW